MENRSELIEKLKVRLNSEIQREQDMLDVGLADPEDDKDKRELIFQKYAYYCLQDYINSSIFFKAKFNDSYVITDETIDVLLQLDYSIALDFIFKLMYDHKNTCNWYSLYDYMNDEYFQFHFLSPLDHALYKKKKEKNDFEV